MFKLLSPFSAFFKRKPVDIYDGVFKLHNKVTVCVLMAFCVLLSAKQFFGKPIDCIIDAKVVGKEFMDNYCWVTGTYTSKISFKGEIGKNILTYGSSMIGPIDYHERNYQKYYQWIVIVLAVQAISFLVPGVVWKTMWEKGIMASLTANLNKHLMSDTCPKEDIDLVVKFILHNDHQVAHTVYAIRYLAAEFFNYLVLIGNVFLVNSFLPEFWMDFLPAINVLLAFEYETWASSTSKFFPKLAKCEFFKVGPSGSMERLDSLCLLPLNILNEKIYAFIYLWFIVLFFLTSLNLIIKMTMAVCKPLRTLYFRLFYRHCIPEVKWSEVLNDGHYGTWFLLKQLGNNLNLNVFKHLIETIYGTERSEYYLK